MSCAMRGAKATSGWKALSSDAKLDLLLRDMLSFSPSGRLSISALSLKYMMCES